ncbi:MAG: branched-chain amino acid ABC transporter permease, partial [Pseudomonadota bacterium]
LTGGLVLGALYALMATGLAVVWTTLGIFNFAHGAFIAVGAYAAWQVGSGDAWGLGTLAGAAVAVAALAALGAGVHQALVKPFERQANIVLISVITTLAGAQILQNVLILIWGPRPKQIPDFVEGQARFLGITLSWNEVVLLAVVAATLLALGWFLRMTPLGRSMRAVAQNREAAQLLGLDVPRLYALSFALSAAMAGLAGVFIGATRFMSPTMGADPLLKALIVVIFGGVARFTSPIYAAFIVGFVEAFATFYAGLYWTPAILFALMIGVLVIAPEGLFGRKSRTV